MASLLPTVNPVDVALVIQDQMAAYSGVVGMQSSSAKPVGSPNRSGFSPLPGGQGQGEGGPISLRSR